MEKQILTILNEFIFNYLVSMNIIFIYFLMDQWCFWKTAVTAYVASAATIVVPLTMNKYLSNFKHLKIGIKNLNI